MLGHKVHEYLLRFSKYDWLWKDDKDVQYKQFVASNPAISDYEVRHTSLDTNLEPFGLHIFTPTILTIPSILVVCVGAKT